MERFSASERESMQQFAARFSIPLLHEIGKSDLLGTACVVLAKGCYYLVSAGHVLTYLKEHPEEVGALTVRNGEQPLTFGSGLHLI